MTGLDAATATWLTSTAGVAAVAAATERLDRGEDELAVATRLRRERRLEPAQATAVLAAAEARRRARGQWAQADELLFTPVGLEQASAPSVSAWRARRLAGQRVWDLGAGLGGDSLAMAAAGAQVTAVDLDAARLCLLEHNARVLGVSVTTLVGDALDLDVPPGAWVHADPSRRRDGRRVRRLADHLPAVDRLLARHGAAAGLALVLSPAVDLEDPALPADAELEFIADAEGLRESVAWLGDARAPGALASATLLPSGEHRVRRGPPPALEVGEVGSHVVEVEPAAVRARLHAEIGAAVGARRLAARRALLTVDGEPPGSPWYRTRAVLEVLPARQRAIRDWLRAHGDVPVELVSHGVALDPERWWRAVGRPRRGPQGVRVELLRTDRGAMAVVTDARPPRFEPLRS